MNKEKNRNDRIRYNILTTLVYIAGIILLIQLFNLQIIHGAEYRETSNSRLTRETVVKAARGSIKDRTGVELVRTDTGYSAEIYSTKVTDAELNLAIEKFIEIHKLDKENINDYAEFEIINKLNDDEAKERIQKLLNLNNVKEIREYNNELRNKKIKELKVIKGISKTQLSRILGINRKIIERAMK